MAKGRRKHDWSMAAEQVAAVYNTVRDSRKRPEPFAGRDFNPMAPPKRPKTHGIEAFGDLLGMTMKQARKAAGVDP